MASIDNIMSILDLQFTGLDGGCQQILFKVDGDTFGIDVLNIQELIRYTAPVKVPKSPDFVTGVINFRGEIIPVLDLRKIFSKNEVICDDFTVISVVETEGKIFGLLVDRVTDIITLSNEQIQPIPEFANNLKTQYLKSIGKMGEQLVLMLDLNRLVDFEKIEESVNRFLEINQKKSIKKQSKKQG